MNLSDKQQKKFDQDKFNQIFDDMIENKVVLEDDLEFNQFPPGIKKRLYSLGFILAVVSFILIYTMVKTFSDLTVGRFIRIIMFFGVVIFYLILRIRILWISTAIKDFIQFSGVVINTQRKGFLTSSRYDLVKITDGEKVINIKYTGEKKIEKGLPITIYMSSNAPIIDTDEGLLAEQILGIEFTDKTNVDGDEPTEDPYNEGLNAKDFFDN